MISIAVCVCSQTYLKRQCHKPDIPSCRLVPHGPSSSWAGKRFCYYRYYYYPYFDCYLYHYHYHHDYFAGGPFNMAEMNKATVHASERVSARDMIQTQFEGDEDLSLMTDKDVAKMKKKAEKDERAARAALAAHQVRPSHLCIITSTCLLAQQLHQILLVLDSGFFFFSSSFYFFFFSHFPSLEPRTTALTQNSFVCQNSDGNKVLDCASWAPETTMVVQVIQHGKTRLLHHTTSICWSVKLFCFRISHGITCAKQESE